MRWTTFILLCLAVALQVFDGWSTLFLFQYGGTEANPLAAWLFGLLGAERTIIFFKYLGAAIVCFIAWIWHDERGARALAVIDGYYLVLLGAFNFRYVLKVTYG